MRTAGSERFRTSRTEAEGQVSMPFFECPEDALKAVVQRLGGAKAVGAQLFPDKAPDAAARTLLDCLNPDRAEKLTLSQVLLILRMAHDAGLHEAMEYIAGEAGYEARPIRLDEQVDALTQVIESTTRRFEAAVKQLARIRGVDK